MADKTINIASRAHTTLHLREPIPEEYKDRPGEAPEMGSVRLGAGHDRGETVTRGVDADVFRKWYDANKTNPIVANGLVREVSDEEADDIEAGVGVYGFEPGLEAIDAEGASEGAYASEDEAHADVRPDMNARGEEPPGGTAVPAGDPELAKDNIARTDKPIAGAEKVA